MKLKQILLFTLCITFFACSTESSSNDEEEKEINDNTLVKTIIYNKGTADESSIIFNYDGNKLTSVDDNNGFKNIYTYENDNLVKDEAFDDGVLNATTTLTYNTNGTLASITETFFEDSGLDDRQYRHDFTYDDDDTIINNTYINQDNTGFVLDYKETITLDGKNITEIFDDGGFKTSLRYDDKKGAFKNIHDIEVLNILSKNEFGALIYGNTNNLITYIETDNTNPNANDLYDDKYEYTYNENNYPITSVYTSKYGNEIDEIETIEYIYE